MMELTPLDVRKKKGDFRRVLRGYDPGVVDDFMDLVADRLEELVREAAAQKESVTRLEQHVADYRDREKALTEALVTAQEMREEIRSQSTREVDLLRRQAEQEAQAIRGEAVRAREREEESLNALRAKQLQFLSSYRTFLEQELADLAAHARGVELQSGRTARARAPAPLTREQEPPPEPSAPVVVGTRPESLPADRPGPAAPVVEAAAPVAAATASNTARALPDFVAARPADEEVDTQVGAALAEWGTEFDNVAGNQAPDLILSDADVVVDEPDMFFGDEPEAEAEPEEPEPEPVREPEPQAVDDSTFGADVSAAFGGAAGDHDDLLDLESFDSLRGGPDLALGESIVGPPPVIPPDQLTISPVFLERAEPDRDSVLPGEEGDERAAPRPDRFSPMFEDDG